MKCQTLIKPVKCVFDHAGNMKEQIVNAAISKTNSLVCQNDSICQDWLILYIMFYENDYYHFIPTEHTHD